MKPLNILEREELQDAIGMKGPVGRWISGILMQKLGINNINRINNKYRDITGPEFASKVLEEVGVSVDYVEAQLDRIPAEGGFITISNHHHGGVDGMIMCQLLGAKRPDYKILTTKLLTKIQGLSDKFLPVDNFSTGSVQSFKGIRMALEHLASGGPLGLFPSGEVATWQPKKNRTALTDKKVVEDIPWADNIIKIISKTKVPVIPVFFDGENSPTFHRLGKIHPRLRTLRLLKETFEMPPRTVKIRIGQAISPDEIAKYDVKELGDYLRNRTYALEAECIEPVKKGASVYDTPVADPVDPELVRAEIEKIEDRMLFQNGDYRVYLTTSGDIPNIMRELGRLREETFRAVGEGTGNALDLDEYDEYYHHLLLWHVPDGQIAGAYRVGFGPEIVKDHGGVKGFYTASLVKYAEGVEPLLGKCMELGRTIVIQKYQREIMPLKLLLAGIGGAALKYPEIEYFLGPVSISDNYPAFYKSMIVWYLQNNCRFPNPDTVAVPTHAFKADWLRTNPSGLMQKQIENIDQFDRLMATISDGKYRLPVLVRKYFNCGAKLVCFNIDPLFGDSLDGLILLRLSEFPANTMRSLVKGLDDEKALAMWQRLYGKDAVL